MAARSIVRTPTSVTRGVLYTSREMSPERCDQGVGAPWTLTDWAAIGLLTVLALVPRTVNLLGLDPFIDEAAWTDWAFRQFELTSPRTWIIPLVTDGRPPLFVWLIVPFGAVVDNGILAGRLASAMAGVLSAVALYVLGRELASRTRRRRGGDPLGAQPVHRLLLAHRRRRLAADPDGDPGSPGPASASRAAPAPAGALCGLAWRWPSWPRRTACCWQSRRCWRSSCSAGRWRGGRTSGRCWRGVRGRAGRRARRCCSGVMPLLQQVATAPVIPWSGRDLLPATWRSRPAGRRRSSATVSAVAGAGLVLALVFRQGPAVRRAARRRPDAGAPERHDPAVRALPAVPVLSRVPAGGVLRSSGQASSPRRLGLADPAGGPGWP